MRLKNYCKSLQSVILSHLMVQWKHELQEEYNLLLRFLYPTDELAVRYPKDQWVDYRVIYYPDGRIAGIDDDDVEDRVKLTRADILCHKFDLKDFRREMCEGFGLILSPVEIGNPYHGIPWGTWEPEKGATFPVTLLGGSLDFRGRVSERILRRKAPGEMIITPTRFGWTNDLEEIARANKVLLVSLDEIVQMEDGKLQPTPEWDEYLTAFCKMVEMDLPSQLRTKPRRNLFAKRGEWTFHFSGKDMMLNGKLQGPAFIRRLMMTPYREVHVEQLWKDVFGTGDGNFAQIESGAEGEWDSFLSTGDDMLDAAGKADYQKRLLQLNRDRAEAESDNDDAWLERIDKETEAISIQLHKAKDGKGRTRKVGDERDRLRKRISKNITDSIKLIASNHRELGDHLKESIGMGEHMSYQPSVETEWLFE